MEEKESADETEPVPEGEGGIEVQKLNGKGLSKQGVINNLNYYIKVKKRVLTKKFNGFFPSLP